MRLSEHEHFMIDMETLSSEQIPVIVQIACVHFNLDGAIRSTFSANIDIDHQVLVGGHISDSTIRWWMHQNSAAQLSVFNAKNKKHIASALFELNGMFKGYEGVTLWSHAAFDAAILNAWYAKIQIHPAYSYKNTLDLRTIRALYDPYGNIGKSIPPVEPKHEALSDCMWQVEWLCACLKKGV